MARNELRVNGTDIPPIFIVGDSAYPLCDWLMKPFPMDSNLTRAQTSYNYHLSRSRVVAENAFGRPKARWRRLCKRNDMHINHVPCVVTACHILHNICEGHNECFNELWLEQAQLNAQQHPPRPRFVGNVGRRTTAIRKALVEHFA